MGQQCHENKQVIWYDTKATILHKANTQLCKMILPSYLFFMGVKPESSGEDLLDKKITQIEITVYHKKKGTSKPTNQVNHASLEIFEKRKLSCTVCFVFKIHAHSGFFCCLRKNFSSARLTATCLRSC